MTLTPLARNGFIFALVVLIADQLSKWWVLESFSLQEKGSVVLLPFLNFTMVWNKGVSMGFLSANGELGRWLLVIVTSGVAIGLAIWLYRGADKWVSIALGGIVGGAIGNIIDRIVHGAVVDFIHLHAFNWSFYVFNVADAAISLGVIILLFDGLRSDDKSPTRDDNGSDGDMPTKGVDE